MIKAVIFDFDGTILDTETPDYESWQQIYQRHGADLPLAVWTEHIGTRSSFSPVVYLEQQLGQAIDREAILREWRTLFHQLLKSEPVRPGVERTLRAAASNGLYIGLASSAGRDWVEDHLKRLGLRSSFQCVRTADDVSRVKPDPELYHAVLTAFRIQPGEAIAFEDSPNGAQAAVNAGVRCVVIPNPLTKELVFPSAVHAHYSSFEDFDLRELIQAN